MATYNTSNTIERERAKARFLGLVAKGAVIELKEFQTQRTLPQNSYLHLILAELAMQTGNELEYVKQEYFKKECNSELFLTQKLDPITKKNVVVIKSTADIDSAQMTIAIDRFRNWAAKEAGIYLPEPNEQEYLQAIAIEAKKMKEYL